MNTLTYIDNIMKGQFQIIVSRGGYDIVSMSTNKEWQSCMSLSKDGKYQIDEYNQ